MNAVPPRVRPRRCCRQRSCATRAAARRRRSCTAPTCCSGALTDAHRTPPAPAAPWLTLHRIPCESHGTKTSNLPLPGTARPRRRTAACGCCCRRDTSAPSWGARAPPSSERPRARRLSTGPAPARVDACNHKSICWSLCVMYTCVCINGDAVMLWHGYSAVSICLLSALLSRVRPPPTSPCLAGPSGPRRASTWTWHPLAAPPPGTRRRRARERGTRCST